MIIYKITNTVNSKIYIGQSIYDDPDYFGSGLLIKRAIDKYGRAAFTKEILDTATSQEELSKKEKYWISHFDSTNGHIGYNITPGGEFGDTFSNHPDKENIRSKMSLAAKKRGNGWLGKKHNDETKKKIGDKNRVHADFRKKTLSNDELKSMYSRPGKKNGMHGRTHTEEARRSIGEKNRIKNSGGNAYNAKSVTIDGVTYSTLKEASKQLGISVYYVNKKAKEQNHDAD